MNNIRRIAVQELALYTVASFLEAAEYGSESRETHDPGVSEERTEVRGILLETSTRSSA